MGGGVGHWNNFFVLKIKALSQAFAFAVAVAILYKRIGLQDILLSKSSSIPLRNLMIPVSTLGDMHKVIVIKSSFGLEEKKFHPTCNTIPRLCFVHSALVMFIVLL